MTQEELKDFILSRISINKEFWKPKIETFFNQKSNVTREEMDIFFRNWRGILSRKSEVFREEYYKARYGDNGIKDIPVEVLLSDVETKKFDVARRENGLIPLEEVSFTGDEVEMAFDELELKG